MKKTVFRGVGTAIVTPMNGDFSVNYTKLGELIESQIASGVDAIVSCGTTGEASTLTDEEHAAVIEYTVKQVKERVPVVAGVGSNDTAYAIWLSKEAKAVGANALLHVTPYYNKTSQKGLVQHFFACADATDLPVILYNVPSRTGLDIKPETYLALSKHPNIVATKEANGNLTSILKTRYLCGGELAIYSGNDDNITAILSLGGIGVISVLSNILPRETGDICRHFFEGKAEESAALQIRYAAFIEALFADVNPIPVKEAMNLMGLGCGPCRLPLAEADESVKARLAAEMRKLGIPTIEDL